MKWLQSKWVKIVLSGTALILIYKLVNNFGDVSNVFGVLVGIVFPLILGAVFAFFLSRPAEKIAKLLKKIKFNFVKKNALALSVVLLYVAIILVIALIIMFVTPGIYKNIEELAKNLPKYYETVINFISENKYLSKFASLDRITQKASEMFKFESINKYIGIISGIANSFVTFFLAIILSIYMIIEKESVFEFFNKLSNRILPNRAKDIVYKYGRLAIERCYSYFTGLAFDALVVGIVSFVFFSILKIPYALILGIIIMLGNLVPFFGPIVSNVLVFIITAVVAGPIKMIWVIVFQVIFGQVDGNIIQPKIVGNSTGISPLLVLTAVIVFGNMFGFVGMIIGVPLLAVIKEIVMDYIEDGKIDSGK